ncbi:hypothetical protein ACQPZ8_01845 [Actinomadura nitritigenes]|uniref:hypothetical protein n=1 Tax=Actinomadura nitritigenes TaxID=134602 RepID=UPI003D8AADD7
MSDHSPDLVFRGACVHTLVPGRLADLTVWDRDPADCPDGALRDLSPTHTFIGGLLVADAGGPSADGEASPAESFGT